MVKTRLLDDLVSWAAGNPDVQVLTLFGSHARHAADAQSDFDLQLIATRPATFESRDWTGTALPGHTLRAYSVRPAFGGVRKVTALFDAGLMDIVVVPAGRMRLGRMLVAVGLHRRVRLVRRGLANLAVVLRPGFRVLKGGAGWQAFYTQIVAEVPDERIDDRLADALGETAYLDYIGLERKLARGELRAAQRWLHTALAETNFKLMHELRLRRNEPSYHDARRLEQALTVADLGWVTVDARLDAAEIGAAAREAIRATHTLVRALTGRAPTWPVPKVRPSEALFSRGPQT